ncbi:MAG TPA: hypothetical protein VIU37_13400, partial [Candidatus Limnocylindrales bacterium]
GGPAASSTSQPSVAQVASPSAGPTATPTVALPTVALQSGTVTTFEGFRDAYCASWLSIFKAVGNPDTGGGSDLSHALDAAVTAGDVAAANQAAAAMKAELEAGRRQAQAGAGWLPAAPFMAELDRFLAAFESGTEAERAAAGPSGVDGRAIWQAAFQAAGGIEAWQAMPPRAGPIASARPPDSHYQCPGIPVSL